jgi:hypothetical protein
MGSTSKSGTNHSKEGSRRQSSASRKHDDSPSSKFKIKVNNQIEDAKFYSSPLNAEQTHESNAENSDSEDKTLENAYV